jgi:DamX protein
MDKTPDTTVLADQITSLSEAVAQQKLEFREAETALVSRIADVDDDRRTTTNRLQRAWQTHRDEIDAKLKHQAKVFAGGLVLLALLLGLALLFAYSQLNVAKRTLLEETAQLRVDYQRLTALSTQDASIQDSLNNLRDALAAVSASLDRNEQEASPRTPTEEPSATDPGPAEVAATSDAESEQPPEAAPEPTVDDASGQDAEQAPEPAPEQAPTQAPPPIEEPASMAPDEAAAPMSETQAPPEAAPESMLVTPAVALPESSVQDLPSEPTPGSTPDSPPEETRETQEARDTTPTSDQEAAPPPLVTETEPTPLDADASAPESESESESEPEPEPKSEQEPEPEPESVRIDTDGLELDSAVAETRTKAQVEIADQPLVVADQPFALQLIGFYSLDTMLDFARREELPSPVYFREESFQGRPWFVLIHSLYTRRSDALEAMEQLPDDLAILDIWIRNLPPETQLGILEIKR